MSNVKPASRQAGVRRETFFHLYLLPAIPTAGKPVGKSHFSR